MENIPALVSADWLLGRLDDPQICVVDASWYMPAEQRNPQKEYEVAHIRGAVFFDIDGVADQSSELPHMLPTEAEFDAAMADLGIGADMHLIIYDGHGLMSAARAWWTFRAFGHERVSVLNGGIKAWQVAGGEIVSSAEDDLSRARGGPFAAKLNQALVRSIEQVTANLESPKETVVDARPGGRFQGIDPEPRPGLRGGHIPGSCNVPFPTILNPDTNTMLPPDQVKQRFLEAGLDLNKPVIASCGSGVTASVLTLGLFTLGKTDVAVYDGSWSEWGGAESVPVATGE